MKKTIVIMAALALSFSVIAQTYTGKRPLSPQEKLNEEYCSGLFKLYEGTIIDVQNDNTTKSYLNILNWLQGRVAGLQVYHRRDGTAIAYIRNSRAGLYIDEIPVDPGYVNTLSVSDIAMIKIIKGPFAGGLGNFSGGVIAIYTIKGDDEEEEEE